MGWVELGLSFCWHGSITKLSRLLSLGRKCEPEPHKKSLQLNYQIGFGSGSQVFGFGSGGLKRIKSTLICL